MGGFETSTMNYDLSYFDYLHHHFDLLMQAIAVHLFEQNCLLLTRDFEPSVELFILFDHLRVDLFSIQ